MPASLCQTSSAVAILWPESHSDDSNVHVNTPCSAYARARSRSPYNVEHIYITSGTLAGSVLSGKTLESLLPSHQWQYFLAGL